MQIFSKTAAAAFLGATLIGSAALGDGADQGSPISTLARSASTGISAHLPGTVELTAGFTDILRIEGSISTVVVGDPNVADGNPLDSGTILLTGRAAGTTNLIALDESGAVLADLMLHVSSRQPGTVTVHRGLDTQVYSCASGLCEGSLSQDVAETASAAAATPAASGQ